MVKVNKVHRWFNQMVSDDDCLRLQFGENQKVRIKSFVLLEDDQLGRIVTLLSKGFETETKLNLMTLKLGYYLMSQDEFRDQDFGIKVQYDVAPNGKSILRIEICEEEYL